MKLSIAQPDDWHLHLRDGDLLEAVISHRLLEDRFLSISTRRSFNSNRNYSPACTLLLNKS